MTVSVHGCTLTSLVVALMATPAPALASSQSTAAQVPSVEISAPQIRLIEEGRSLPVDLPSAVHLASANNLTLLEAKSRYQEKAGLRDAALGRFAPQFTGSFTAEKIEGQIQASFGELGRRSFSTIIPAAGVELRLNPGSALFEALAAHRTMRATGAEIEHVSQQVLAQVAIQYFELQAALARVSIANQAVAASRELTRVAAAREARGTGLKVDVVRAQARLAADEIGLAQAGMDFRGASLALASSLDLDPTLTLFPAEGVIKQTTLADLSAPLDKLIAGALTGRPDLEEQAMRVAAANNRVSAAWADAVGPSLYGFFEESEIGLSIGALDNRQIYGGGIGLTFRPESIGLIRAAATRTEMAKLQHKRLRQRIATEVISARERVLTSGEEVEAALRQIGAAEASFDLSQARFKGGVGISLEVLEAQVALSKSRNAMVFAITGYNEAQVALLRAVGNVSPSSLGVK